MKRSLATLAMTALLFMGPYSTTGNAVADASPPVPTIVSTVEDGQEVIPGDFIELDATTSASAKLFKWKVKPSQFSDGKPTFRVSQDGKRVWIASRQGSYLVQLIIANEEAIADTERTIVVGRSPAPNPGPSPNPNPNPIPGPPKFPDEEMGMSTFSYNAFISQPDRSKAKALAQAAKQIGGAAVAGGFATVEEAETAMAEANRKAACGDKDPNSPEGIALRNVYLPFFKALQPEIKTRKLGVAASVKGYGKMLIEIGNGVEATIGR